MIEPAAYRFSYAGSPNVHQGSFIGLRIVKGLDKMRGPRRPTTQRFHTGGSIMADRKLNIAVIGTGRWARLVHAPGVQSHPQAELVAV